MLKIICILERVEVMMSCMSVFHTL